MTDGIVLDWGTPDKPFAPLNACEWRTHNY